MESICLRIVPENYREIVIDIYAGRNILDNTIFKAFKYIYDISIEDGLLVFLKSAS